MGGAARGGEPGIVVTERESGNLAAVLEASQLPAKSVLTQKWDARKDPRSEKLPDSKCPSGFVLSARYAYAFTTHTSSRRVAGTS